MSWFYWSIKTTKKEKTYAHNSIPWFNMKLLSLFVIIIVLNGVFGRPQNLDDDYDIDLKCFEYRSEGYRYVEQTNKIWKNTDQI